MWQSERYQNCGVLLRSVRCDRRVQGCRNPGQLRCYYCARTVRPERATLFRNVRRGREAVRGRERPSAASSSADNMRLSSVSSAGTRAMVGGLWEGPIRTLARPRAPPAGFRRDTNAAGDRELVPDPEFLESQRLESEGKPIGARELQLVLDPEYL